MKIDKYSSLILILVMAVLFSGCSSVKSAFDSGRKNGSEEFLVEKKSPLSMPPDFDKLPVPQVDKEEKIDQDQDKDIELLITKDIANQENTDQINDSDEEFLELILDKIRNN
jgi:PBP1b-binding outer membrane lipoprotein LpoB